MYVITITKQRYKLSNFEKFHFFQKFGSCCSLRSKLLYHCWRQEKGTKVSADLVRISPPVTAKLLAKLNKFSTIF